MLIWREWVLIGKFWKERALSIPLLSMSLELEVHQSRGGWAVWPWTYRLDPRDFFGLDFSGAVIGGGLAKPPTQPLLCCKCMHYHPHPHPSTPTSHKRYVFESFPWTLPTISYKNLAQRLREDIIFPRWHKILKQRCSLCSHQRTEDTRRRNTHPIHAVQEAPVGRSRFHF